MARRPKTKPAPVALAISHALAKAGLKHLILQVEVVAAWPLAVGPAMAAHTWPELLKDSTLTVATDHPAWRQEIHYRKEHILELLNARLGQGGVKEINTVVKSRPGGPVASEEPPLTPGPEANRFGESVAAPVDDAVLREAVARAAAAHAEARHRGRRS